MADEPDNGIRTFLLCISEARDRLECGRFGICEVLALQRIALDPDIPISISFIQEIMGWRDSGGFKEVCASFGVPFEVQAYRTRTTDAVRDLWTQIENEQRSESGEVKHSVQYAAVTQSLMEVLSGGNVANVDMLRKILQCQKRTIMCVLGILGAARVVRWEGPHVSLRSEDEASGEVWNLKKRMRSCDEACRELRDRVAGLEADNHESTWTTRDCGRNWLMKTGEIA